MHFFATIALFFTKSPICYPPATLLKIDAFSQGYFSNVAIILLCRKYVVILQADNFLVLTIMIITLCILILVYLIKGKPVDESLKQLEDVDWRTSSDELWNKIRHYALKAGRVATRPILSFYYVMQDAETTTLEKALIYGAVAYVVIPADLLPRKVLGFLGILDDVAVIAYVQKKVAGKITAAITNKVEDTLDSWFGAEAVVVE